MWSFGCVAAELFLGKPIFPGQSTYNLLQLMIQTLGGQPPDHFLQKAKETRKYFKHAGLPTQCYDCTGKEQYSSYQFLTIDEYKSRVKDTPSIWTYNSIENLEGRITSCLMKKGMNSEEMERECNKMSSFVDFLKGLLNFDPLRRWTPRQAADHPFVTGEPFTGSFQPQPESPRMSIFQGKTADQIPVAKRAVWNWLCGEGLSPQVSPDAVLHYVSPQYSGRSSSNRGSYYSTGSYEGFRDGGSYANHQTTLAIENICLGISPDTFWRMDPLPHVMGGAPIGLSPMSFVVSPTMMSPSHHMLLSPAPSNSGAAANKQTASSFGSDVNATSGSLSSCQNNPMSTQHGAYHDVYARNDGATPSCYIESTVQSCHLSSFCNSLIKGSHHASLMTHRNGKGAGSNSGGDLFSYPTGSLGAIMNKMYPNSKRREGMFPPPNNGDWDQSYSEEQLMKNDGEALSSSNSPVTRPSLVAGTRGVKGFSNMAPISGLSNSGTVNLNQHMQDGLKTAVSGQNGTMPLSTECSPQQMQGDGDNVPKQLYHDHHSQKISLNHQFHAQNFKLCDQPSLFNTPRKTCTINGEKGDHDLLTAPKREDRTEHAQVMPPD